MTRRSRRSMRLPATTAATAMRRARSPANILPPTGCSTGFYRRQVCECAGFALSSAFRLDSTARVGDTMGQCRRATMRRCKSCSGQSSSGRLMDSLSTLVRAGIGAAASRPIALWRAPRTSDELWNRLFLALLLIAAVLVVLTFRSYGVTWDEDMQRWYGDLVLDHYLSWIGLAKKPNWLLLYSYGDLYNYGAVFDMTASALNRFSPLGVFETRHLLNAVVGLAGIVGAWKLGKRLGGARVGFLGALFLLLTPNYYGQMFNNPKDIPFAVGFVWATYYLVRIVPFLPRPPLRLVIKLGVATGLAMAVRVGGLLLVCYLGLMLALFATWEGFAARRVGVLIATGWISLWRVYLP